MFCPKCGNQVADSADFCSRCGKAVSTVEPNKPKASSKVWLLWFLLVPILMSVVLSFVPSSSTSETKTDLKSVEHIASTGNPAHDLLVTHKESEQAFLLGKIVQEGCSGNRAFYMGMDKEHDAFWSVGCTNGQSYEVEVHPDSTGSGKVLECSFLKLVHINCFEKLSDQR